MKAIMLSIQPRHVENICTVVGHENGKPIYKKTVEVRKTAPKCETPFKCYIYETKALCDTPTFVDEDGHISYRGRGAVIGEFVCNKVCVYSFMNITSYPDEEKQYFVSDKNLSKTCLSIKEFENYGDGRMLYGWHISDLKIYDKPKELWEFFGYGECEPDPIKCHACKYMEHGNSWAGIEADCNAAYDGLKQLNRPPQSWCYVEEIDK